MGTVEFEISSDDMLVVISLLEDVEGARFYRQVWQALDSERERRAAGAGPVPIRLDRDRAIEFSEWLSQRARAHGMSSDAGDRERGQQLARVAIAVESVLKNAAR
jgi:hypothetical protein